MKISILLPYKENFSPSYAGAVSLMIKDTSRYSKYSNAIIVIGSTNYKKLFDINYRNIKLNKKIFTSKTKEYLNKFIEIEKGFNSDLIEIHNRPSYIQYLKTKIFSKFILYFHNDPLSIKGSISRNERLWLLENCENIIVISKWIKKQFIQDLKLDNDAILNKILIIPHSIEKTKNINLIKKKEKKIIYVGRLNYQKGYDLFGEAIIKILKEFKDWKALVIGDEPRQKFFFNYPSLKLLGFLNHDKVINLFTKSSIAVVPSRWQEPLGRTGFEASSRGCAVIISNRGGLPETITNGVVLNKLSVNEIYNSIRNLIINEKLRRKLQALSIKNFKLDTKTITKKIDNYRDKFNKKIFLNFGTKNQVKILHITNFNERFDGRLHYNTGKRLNNGFIRNYHNVLSVSDRDIINKSKRFNDPTGLNTLNETIIKTQKNFKPDLVVLGHVDGIYLDTINTIRNNNIKICQWFLDPLNIYGPDYSKNKKRILNLSDNIDCTFLTTDPNSTKFTIANSFFIPNPVDESFEILKNYNQKCPNDLFFAMSHGVHRGTLKVGKLDEREIFIKKLMKKNKNIKYDIYGMNKIQPIWGDVFLDKISKSSMGLNLSRGKPIKYYSSDRIAQLMGNGLLTFIDENYFLGDFFSNKEIVTYKNLNDLSDKLNKYKKDIKLNKFIAKNGRNKYFKYFNSNIVADFIVNKTLGIKNRNKYLWNEY